MRSSSRLLRLTVVMAATSLLLAGCTPRRGTKWALPLEITAKRIMADDTGAWVVMGRRAIAKANESLPPNFCLVRRYGRDGSMQSEANLGVGICCDLRADSHGVLVLLVNDVFTHDEWAALWRSDGIQWQNCGRLPCLALGISRLASGSILIWDTTRLFESTDEGLTWSRLPLTFPRTGQWRLSRESIVTELPDGAGIVMAATVYEGGQRNTVRVGRYSPAQGFNEELSRPGMLAGSAIGPDGDALLLVHESDQTNGEPSLKLYELSPLTSAPHGTRVIYEAKSMLPQKLNVTGREVIIVGSAWSSPTSFFSTFPTAVTSLRKLDDGNTWITRRERQIEAWTPREVSMAPDGHAWCTYSNLNEHGLVLVEGR